LSYLLDTNVISEPVRPVPSVGVLRWLHELPDEEIYLSAMSIGEIRFGIEKLATSRRRTKLEAWLSGDLRRRLGDRILPLDGDVCETWGRMVANAQRRGRPLSIPDAFIAATAAVHRLTLVTRDVADFAGTDVPLFNPWDLG
jgi:predicted nucleic acid-binding protein